VPAHRVFYSANPEQPNPAFAKLIAVTKDVRGREQLIAFLEERIAQGQYAQARVRVARLLYGPPVDWPVSFRITGPDTEVLREIGHQVRNVMQQNPTRSIPTSNGMSGHPPWTCRWTPKPCRHSV